MRREARTSVSAKMIQVACGPGISLVLMVLPCHAKLGLATMWVARVVCVTGGDAQPSGPPVGARTAVRKRLQEIPSQQHIW